MHHHLECHSLEHMFVAYGKVSKRSGENGAVWNGSRGQRVESWDIDSSLCKRSMKKVRDSFFIENGTRSWRSSCPMSNHHLVLADDTRDRTMGWIETKRLMDGGDGRRRTEDRRT
jgi:hypothetical protein